MQAETNDGDWMALPTVEHAVSHGTPFPDFDTDGEWQVKNAAREISIEQIQRIVEEEQ